VWNPNPTQPKNTKPPVFLFENHISLRSSFHFDSQFSSARLLFTPRGLAKASPKQVLVLTIYSSKEGVVGMSWQECLVL
ncbi:hypothetical protein HAX54_007956, partial [Datura stramonium]|nr:hypothetical protein [Datura stramonium]